MKASLRGHAAPAVFLAAIFAAGVASTGFAQTTKTTTTPAETTPTAPPATSPQAGASSSATTSTSTDQAQSGTTGMSGTTMEQMANQRIAELHASLHITAHEQSHWNRFAAVMRENAKDLDQAYQQRAESFPTMNAVENMKSYAKIEQMRARDVQKLVPAFQTLYASLSTQQKQDADQLFRSRAEAAQQKHMAASH